MESTPPIEQEPKKLNLNQGEPSPPTDPRSDSDVEKIPSFEQWKYDKGEDIRAHKPIEQEIEAGLRKHHSIGTEFCEGRPPVTRIYLPADKYEEYVKLVHAREGGKFPPEAYAYSIHGIPVYCGGPDIHYCTD